MSKPQIAGSVIAGFPSPAEQYLEPPLDLNERLIKRPAATYFVRVQGDSMIGRGVYVGDLLVVDRYFDPCDGNVVIVAVARRFHSEDAQERDEGNRRNDEKCGQP